MPREDIAELWEAHCRYEFETPDLDATMAMMAAQPYVNHLPTRMDWMLPGIEITGRSLEIPTVAIVPLEGDKRETARKVLDVSLPSNTLIVDAPSRG